MNDVSYTDEKLYIATHCLVGDGDIKDRLYNAYISSLHVLTKNDFPEHLRQDYLYVESMLTKVEATGDEGNATASINALTDEEAVKIAEKILDLAFDIAEINASDAQD
ncbi:MAG: hypothetical protein JO316_04635 [Abitibacteriaceae bacterium]|nr:hypothetical protein [Abditibacteriaceae bacterium]